MLNTISESESESVEHSAIIMKTVLSQFLGGCAYPLHLQCTLIAKEIFVSLYISHYLAHTEPLFMSLEILPLEKIFYHRCGLMMYKYHNNNLLPCPFSQLYAKNDSIHNHNTRCCNLLRVPHGSKSFFTSVSAQI